MAHRAMLRIYRGLLVLFPRRYRREHGPEMVRVVEEMWREHARDEGRRPQTWISFWARAFVDLVAQGLSVRVDGRPHQSEGRWTPRVPKPSLDGLLADVRYGFSSLRHSPGLTATAVVTLALGIGATTSVFSIADVVALRPLPYPEPDRLVRVFEVDEGAGDDRDTFSGANYVDWQASATSFAQLAAYRTLVWTLTDDDYPRRVLGTSVTPGFFAVFEVEPLIGRVFSPAVDVPGGDPVAVIGYRLWQTHFGGDLAALGQTLTLSEQPYTVVGVMPPGFDFPPRVGAENELWTVARTRVPDPPFDFGGDPAEDRTAGYLSAVGRLAPGVDLAAAQAEMSVIAERLRTAYPEANADEGIALVPLQEAISGDARPLLYMLLGAVGLVLLIACSNVANLLLAKAVRREREIAVRRALGASGWRILRQLLTESLLLAFAGGALGVLLARYGTSALVTLAPDVLDRARSATVDLRVLAFALVAVLGTGLLFGLAPAARLVERDLQRAVRENSGRLSSGRRRRRLGRVLIVAEVALSLVLVVGASLMVRTLVVLSAVDPGFDTSDTMVAHVVLPEARYQEDDQIVAFFDNVLEKIRATPGIESAGAVLTLPMHWNIRGTLRIAIEGRAPDDDDSTTAGFQLISPGYFRTLRIPLLRGRLLTDGDRSGSPPVALVNEAFVAKYFPDEDPLGKRITWNDPEDETAEWTTIVGVVADTRVDGLDAGASPETYRTYAQSALGYTTLVARSSLEPGAVVTALRAAVLAVDPEQPLSGISSMDDVLADSLGDRRFNVVLLGCFAVAALAMAAVGLYGVLSFSVGQRTREIGLRRALGARPRQVVRMVVGEGFGLVVVGLALGAGGGLVLGRYVASQIYGISALDPASYCIGGLTVAVVSLLACFVPAHRAASVHPLQALRPE